MKEKHQVTQQHINANSDQQIQEEEQQLQFNQSSGTNQLCILWACIALIVGLVIFGSLKIAYILQHKSVVIYGQFQQFQYQPLPQNTVRNPPIVTNIGGLIEVLEQSYKQVSLQQATQDDIINAERITNYFVGYGRNLRKTDYENAKLDLQQILSYTIQENSEIKFQQFLEALALLQLPTLPYQDPTSTTNQLIAEQYRSYSKRWKFKEKQEQICAIMVLTHKGLVSQSYYYAIRSLFQQQYRRFKVVVIDNTPQLGLQVNILGLLKEVGRNRTIVLDKVNGDGLQGSAVYLALHKYCKGTQITIILRDTGELIGSYAFALLNQVHKVKQVPIVASHYLLDVENVFTNLDGDYRYRVELYRPYKNSSNPRFQPYKAKYIKSFKTSLLQTLPQSVFHNQKGYWYSTSFQARLQFAALERVCGKHYILPQILYKLPKSNIQTKEAVIDAQKASPLKCFQELTRKAVNIQEEQQLPEIQQFDSHSVDLKKLAVLTKEELKEITTNFDYIHKQRQIGLKRQASFANDKPQSKLPKDPTKNQTIAAFGGLLASFRTEMVTYRDAHQVAAKNESNIKLQTLNLPNKTEEYQIKSQSKEVITNEKEKQSLPQAQSTYFCILLITENNQHDFGFFYSIQSVLRQKYSAYRLAIIDNASVDKTLKILHRYQLNSMHTQRKKIKLVGLQRNLPKGQLLYFGVRKFCQSNEFLIEMQSGEQFIGNDVLSTLNNEHRQSGFLAVHSGSLQYYPPSYKFNLYQSYDPKTLKERDFRYQQYLFTPLKSFRVDLFLRIQEMDFKRKDKWMNNLADFNVSYAVLEMACQHIQYINKILYKVPKPIRYFPSDEAPFSSQQSSQTQSSQTPSQPPPNPPQLPPRSQQIINISSAKIFNQSSLIEQRNSTNPVGNGTKASDKDIQSALSTREVPKPKYQCFVENFLTINP